MLGREGNRIRPGCCGTTEDRTSTARIEIAARESRTILFGDVRGFSRLSEAAQLLFLDHVIGGFADVLDACPAVDYAETAGDRLFVVLSDIQAGVDCAFALQSVLKREDVANVLPSHLGLWLSAHVGPLHKRFDRVIRRDKFRGMEVIRTARIEPVRQSARSS